MNNKRVYVYSTKTLKNKRTIHTSEGDICYNPWFKIGMTTQDGGATERVRQQDGTSNPETLDLLYELDLVKEGHPDSNAYDIEQKIHRSFDRRGLRVRDRREWFEVEGGLNDIKLSIESILDDTDLHKSDILLKFHQERAIDKICSCFISEYKRCLLNHKPRSGKTFITIEHIRRENYKNVIILTSFPILNYQWEETFKDFKGFLNYNIITSSGLSEIKLDKVKNNILLLSLQDAKGGDEIFSKEKFDLIKDIDWDLMVIDEIHYGVETIKTADLLTKIKHKRLLGLSATPTKNLICGSFDKDQIDTYSLAEEMMLKKTNPAAYPYANINFYLWNLLEKERKDLKYFSDEEQFTFEKFFRIENNDFYYKDDIIYFFKKLIGSRDLCSRDKLGTEYPFKNSGVFNGVKSILLFLPRIEVQEKLKELLESIDILNENFNFHITNSEINSSRELMKKIKRDFKSKTDKRSFIMAVDQLTTGITLEDCDMVMFMNDWRSVDKYIQASFRCQSPRFGKENCFVIDFNAARSFEMIWEYNNILSKNNGKSLEQTIREWIESVNIFNRIEGGLKQIDFDSFNTEYDRIISEKPRFNYSSVIFEDKLKDEQIKKALSVIGLGGSNSSTNSDMDEDGIGKGKSKKGKKGSVAVKKVVALSDAKIMEIAKALIDKTMLLTIFTGFKHDKVDDCFNDLISDNTIIRGIGEIKRSIFLDVLLLGINDVDKVDIGIIKYIYDNIYDKNIIDKKLYIFNQKVNIIYNSIRENPDCISIMHQNLVKLIDDYLKPSNSEKKLHAEVMTPGPKINETLDVFDESVWVDPTRTWFGPSAGLGNFQVLIVNRLMEGLKTWQPDSDLRLKHILENMIYVCELQSKNMFLFLMIFDPEQKYKLNYFRGSFLSKEFDNHMKNVWKKDHFDFGAENPPFNQMIDMDFLTKCHKLCDQVAFIHPSTWLLDEKNKQKKFTKTKEIVKDSLEKVILFNGNKLFQIGLFVPCAITFFDKNKKTKGIKCIDKINNTKIIYDDIYQINKFSNLNIYTNLKNKILNKSKDNIWSFYKDKNRNIVKDYMISFTGIRGNVNLKSDESMIQKDFYTIVSVDRKTQKAGTIVGESFLKFYFTTENECDNFLNYLKTSTIRFCLSIYKNNQNLHRGELEIVPYLDFTKEWTDEKLIKEFKLTEDEVNFINKNIPKYYE